MFADIKSQMKLALNVITRPTLDGLYSNSAPAPLSVVGSVFVGMCAGEHRNVGVDVMNQIHVRVHSKENNKILS